MRIRKKAITLMAVVLLGIVIGSLTVTEHRLTRLENGVLRLHILADSDAAADQADKLAVRDALLARAGEWMYHADTQAEAVKELEANLSEIEAIAQETLRKRGSEAGVRAMVCETEFPVRTYGSVTLPAGTYQALRVEIGTGSGRNWWCVMYPSLCVPAAGCERTETDTELMHDTFDAGVCDLAEHPSRYEVRLKCVEILRGIRKYVAQQFEGTDQENGMESDTEGLENSN